MIELHCGTDIHNIDVDDSSYRYRSLMGKPQLVLKFSMSEYIDIPVGAWCIFQNERYVLNVATNLTKRGTRNIEYNMTMGGDEDRMGLYKMRNSVDRRLKYSMCAKPHEIVGEIVANLNERDGDGVWSVGDCIESSEKTIEFNHTYTDDALQQAAELFETEWEIVGKAISLHKVEYFKEDPLPLSYGKGNGFIPGVGRTTESDEMPIRRIYAQGGDRNIDRSKYGGWDEGKKEYATSFPYKLSSAELRLPASQTLEYEGRTYRSDADGYYIERVDKKPEAVKEDSLDCSEIYPSRVGRVGAVEVPNAAKNFYDIIDRTIPESLNYNDHLIAGETATVIFQSGMLSGKEFEFKYKHAERRFELVPQEIDGVAMPNETFKPEVGDTYAVFGIMLPDEYICNNADKSGASWDMFRECARKLYENEGQKFTFKGEMQGLWAKRNWLRVGGRLKVGGYILFSDTQFAPEGMPIRITGIKDYVNSPHSPTIELSNSVSGKSVSSQLKGIDSQEVTIEDTKDSIVSFTKRRFRDAVQAIEMLNGAMLNFSEAVNPVTVQTMAALIGDESMQFRFVENKENLTAANYQITYDNAARQLHCPHGFLQHMTLGISGISSSHADSEYKVWEVAEYLSPVLTEADKKYYLYAKVSRNDTSAKGEFLLSEKAVAMDGVDNYCHLLVGVLNSETEGERSYVSLYGFTEILPGRITTDRIVSSDGRSYFDMSSNAMKLGDALDYNSRGDRRLTLRGTLVQSLGGDTNPIGCFRGEYDAGKTYYEGDEVTFPDDGALSTYRVKSGIPISGVPPTDTGSWEVVASGGKDGSSAAPVYRGRYDMSKTYYGYSARVDIVRDGDAFYVARTDSPAGMYGFSGIPLSDTAYWRPFGGSFESIATGLLLADNANVAGWIFRDGRLYSEDGGCYLDGAAGNIMASGFVTKKMLVVGKDNVHDYLAINELGTYTFDFKKSGSLVMVNDLGGDFDHDHLSWDLPSLYSMYASQTSEENKNNARSYIGCMMLIYNNSSVGLGIGGAIADSTDDPGFNSVAIEPGNFKAFECRIRTGLDVAADGTVTSNGREEVYWLVAAQGKFK